MQKLGLGHTASFQTVHGSAESVYVGLQENLPFPQAAPRFHALLKTTGGLSPGIPLPCRWETPGHAGAYLAQLQFNLGQPVECLGVCWVGGMKGRVQSRGALEGFQVALVSAALTLPRPLPGETQPGMSAPIPITLTRVGGYSGSPAWTVEGLPGAVTAAFNPSATGEPASFTLSVAQGASAGTSTLTVRATDGTLTATALLSLTLSTGNDYRLNPNVLELLDSNVTVLDVTVNTDGTGFANLTNNSYSINHPAWGPGGIIAFDAADAFGVKQVFTLNLAGGTVTQITHGATNSRHPSWSPDGTYLLYEFQTDIPSTLVARTSPAIPHSYDIIYANDTKNFLDPSYSANGRQILFRDDSYFYVTSDSGTLTYQIAMGTILLKHPVFSPDGSQIAADANPVGPPSILVMKADGTLATSIATDFYPSWRKIQ